MKALDLLPIAGPLIVSVWHGYKVKQFERELWNIYKEQNIPIPNVERSPFKNYWSIYHVKSADSDITKSRKNQLLAKIGEHSLAAAMWFVGSFICLVVLVLLLGG